MRMWRGVWRSRGSESSAAVVAKPYKNAVILNGVSPWAKAGAKRSEGSLTATRAEAVW